MLDRTQRLCMHDQEEVFNVRYAERWFSHMGTGTQFADLLGDVNHGPALLD